MRIAIVHTVTPEPSAECERLSRELCAAGHDVDVFALPLPANGDASAATAFARRLLVVDDVDRVITLGGATTGDAAVVDRVGEELAALGIDHDDVEALALVTRQLRIFCAPPTTEQHKPLRTLGIWFAFNKPTSLFREGITRFTAQLITHLVERYGLAVEIWTYDINRSEVEKCFADVLAHPLWASRIEICTEARWADELPITAERDNLFLAANAHSRADMFMIAIHYLGSGVHLQAPRVIALHDLITFEYYEHFGGPSLATRTAIADARLSVDAYARTGAFFFSNSEYVRREHALRFIHNLDEARTATVYLPVTLPAGIHERVPPRETITARHGIVGDYLFCPTQLRPHKNVITLVRALARLRDGGRSLTLVLTAPLRDDAQAQAFVDTHALGALIVCARDVSEDDLYALHAHAVATVVPTLFEGGFPWQAMEAMLMQTPAIFSRIAVVDERVHWAGIAAEVAATFSFAPTDEGALAELITMALADRAAFVRRQSPFKEALLAYDWPQAAAHYHALFTRFLAAAQDRS